MTQKDTISDLPKPERWLMWKVSRLLPDEDTPRLLTPRADPMVYETPFDFFFENEQEAFNALETFDAEDEAREEGWVLCEMTLTPNRFAG